MDHMAFMYFKHSDIQIATKYPGERALHKTRQHERHQDEKFAYYLAVQKCKSCHQSLWFSLSLSEAVVKWLWSSSTFKKIEMIHFPLFARLQFLCSYSILEEKQENDPIYRQGFLFLKPPPSTIDHSMAKLEKMYKICIPELFVLCHLVSRNNFFWYH